MHENTTKTMRYQSADYRNNISDKPVDIVAWSLARPIIKCHFSIIYLNLIISISDQYMPIENHTITTFSAELFMGHTLAEQVNVYLYLCQILIYVYELVCIFFGGILFL